MTMAVIGILAGLWIGVHLALWMVSPWLMPRDGGAYTNGLFIVVPRAARAALSPDEVAALKAHEWGHIRHGHPYMNLLRSILCLRRSLVDAKRQEIQADDFAARRGHGPALASVLRKHGASSFDLFRADRIAAR